MDVRPLEHGFTPQRPLQAQVIQCGEEAVPGDACVLAEAQADGASQPWPEVERLVRQVSVHRCVVVDLGCIRDVMVRRLEGGNEAPGEHWDGAHGERLSVGGEDRHGQVDSVVVDLGQLPPGRLGLLDPEGFRGGLGDAGDPSVVGGSEHQGASPPELELVLSEQRAPVASLLHGHEQRTVGSLVLTARVAERGQGTIVEREALSRRTRHARIDVQVLQAHLASACGREEENHGSCQQSGHHPSSLPVRFGTWEHPEPRWATLVAMAHVLVANPYVLALDPHEHALRRPYAPVNTLVSAAALVEAGHEVRVHDATFEQDERHFEAVVQSAVTAGATHLALVLDDLSVQVKQCPARIGEAQRTMADLGRAAGLQVLVSGPDVSDHPESYLGHADSVVVGDPVDAIVAWSVGQQDIPGVRGRQGGGGRTALIRDLDRLPDPDWDAIDLQPYARMWREAHGYWEAVVSTARGCPYRCNWCAKPTWGRSYSVRSPERVAAEIRLLAERHGADRFWISDDIFGLRRRWLEALAGALDQPRPLRCQSRVDLLRERRYAEALARTGCDMVWMGAESGSDEVLRAMDKDGSVADTHVAVANLRSLGVGVGLFLQLGYPGETLADVHSTIEMVKSLRPDEIGVSVSYPLPGTVFHAHVAHVLEATHWQASMENRTLHPAPFSEDFYREAREVLRSVHSGGRLRERGWDAVRRPSRRSTRRLLGSVWHRLRRPLVERRMAALAVPNPEAIPLSWGGGSPLAGPAGAHGVLDPSN